MVHVLRQHDRYLRCLCSIGLKQQLLVRHGKRPQWQQAEPRGQRRHWRHGHAGSCLGRGGIDHAALRFEVGQEEQAGIQRRAGRCARDCRTKGLRSPDCSAAFYDPNLCPTRPMTLTRSTKSGQGDNETSGNRFMVCTQSSKFDCVDYIAFEGIRRSRQYDFLALSTVIVSHE